MTYQDKCPDCNIDQHACDKHKSPREPDRYGGLREHAIFRYVPPEARETVADLFAAALRAEHDATVQASIDACDNAIGALQGDREVEAALECIKRIRDLASPAAAPAAETTGAEDRIRKMDESASLVAELASAARRGEDPPFRVVESDTQPSEPVAPAPDLRNAAKEAQQWCDIAESRRKRIAELERALREARDWIAGEGSIVPERLVGRIDAALAGDGSAET